MREQKYFVRGMHCASCEILIEKKLLEISEVVSANASVNTGEVILESQGQIPRPQELTRLFASEGYVFSDRPIIAKEKSAETWSKSLPVILLAVFGFIFLLRSGFAGFLVVNSSSSLPMLFLFGLLAGVTSCGALIGGLVLSMAKQWFRLYGEQPTLLGKLQPHLLFNVGRILTFTLMGGILGALGSRLAISPLFTSLLTMVVSFLMIFLGLQMLGFINFGLAQLILPRNLTRYVANEKNFQGRYLPFFMGAGSFFLPCGFTITAQGLALLSGNPISGALILLFFVLGTTTPLLGIGLASIKFLSGYLALRFSRVAGVLILFFALFNLNNSLAALGLSNLSNLSGLSSSNQTSTNLPPLVNGQQVLKMNASSSGYSPNSFQVRAGQPVRWEVTDIGTSGCTNAIISNSLFSGQIDLTPGQTSVKEFTAPTKPGKYRFSCWMGMISGVIEVVDEKSPTAIAVVKSPSPADNNTVIPSGAKGCGCGGGGGGSCGGKKN